jgi:hypothetical protein
MRTKQSLPLSARKIGTIRALQRSDAVRFPKLIEARAEPTD